MGLLSNPLSPIQPYARAIKSTMFGIAGLALLGLAGSWYVRGQKIERLEITQQSIVSAATVATVKPDKNGRKKALRPEDVPAAIQALANSLSSADRVLTAISEGTMTAKAASDAADRVLADRIARMQKESSHGDPTEWNPWEAN